MIEPNQQIEAEYQDEKGIEPVALLFTASCRLLVVIIESCHYWFLRVK